MVDSMEPCKMLWADPCCHGNEFWAKITYNSACMTQTFAYNGVFGDGRFNGTMQNLVRPTLVAMATTFELGAEFNRLPACVFVTLHYVNHYITLINLYSASTTSLMR